jgi:hypothetical protein
LDDSITRLPDRDCRTNNLLGEAESGSSIRLMDTQLPAEDKYKDGILCASIGKSLRI